MEATEAGRFQVWDYRVSHRQLLLRRPATGANPSNVDLVFKGVKYLSLPTTIRNPKVRPALPSELPGISQLLGGKQVKVGQVHVIEGDGVRGFVVSESARRVVNELDLFESSLEPYADTRFAAETFEREVLVALASFKPDLEPVLPDGLGRRSRGLDALIQLPNRTIGVDVRWVREDQARRSTRSRVVDAVERLDPWLDHIGALLMVFGTHDQQAIAEAQDHMVTALGAHLAIRVVGWTPDDDPKDLQNAVRALAA